VHEAKAECTPQLGSGEKIFAGAASAPVTVAPPAAPISIAPAAPSPEPQKTEYRLEMPLPDLIPFDRYFDGKAPVMLKGKVKGIETFWGHAALVVEEIETGTPGYTRVPNPGTSVRVVWRVVLGRVENAPAWAKDPALTGQRITVIGYKGKDACELECMMTGREVQLDDAWHSGWRAPYLPAPKPKAAPPI